MINRLLRYLPELTVGRNQKGGVVWATAGLPARRLDATVAMARDFLSEREFMDTPLVLDQPGG